MAGEGSRFALKGRFRRPVVAIVLTLLVAQGALLASGSSLLHGRSASAHNLARPRMMAVGSVGSTAVANVQPAPLDGIPTNCPGIDIGVAEIPDGGWTWVDANHPIQQVTGVVNQTQELDPEGEDPTKISSFVRFSDLPTAHDSHDQNTHLVVDVADRGLLSLINDLADDHADVASPGDISPPSQLEVEWETGISPFETHGDGHAGTNGGPIFPKWAWPNPGDRVWIMGNHIYDCGHPIKVAGTKRYKSEIHPAIAMAAMRDQVMTLPGTGTTPVPVVATDLYIHGDGGWATSVLNTHEVFDQGTHYMTPIARDYDFDIHLPAKPSPTAQLKWTVSNGPNNNINIAPLLTPNLSDPADPKLHVHIPLAGSGVDALDTYGRQIVAGWAVPQGKVRHLRITLTRMVLHEDMELAGSDGELSFFWLNVPKSPTEWQRMSDFEIPTFEDPGPFCANHTNIMNDYDDDHGCGNGILNFSGPTFDLFVMDGTPVSIQAYGWDQDCLDDWFGIHNLGGLLGVGQCYFAGNADNDPYKTLKVALNPPGYGVGQLNVANPDNQYELRFTVAEVDSTPPTASPVQSPPANAAGWNKSDVTVNWNWADEGGGSGIDPAHCTTSSVSSGEGNAITLNASCTDHAGNTGNASYTVKVDKTAPTFGVSGLTLDREGPWGAHMTVALLHVTDNLDPAPVVTCTPSLPRDVPTGTSTTFKCTAKDVADNSTPLTSIKVTVPTPPPGTCVGLYQGGLMNGNLAVRAGKSCTLESVKVNGNLSVSGGKIVIHGGLVNGQTTVTNALSFEISGATLNGQASFRGTTGASSLCATQVTGNLTVANNSAAISIGHAPACAAGNKVVGNGSITGNTARVSVSRNRFVGTLACSGNSPPPNGVAGSNTAMGKTGQCAGL